jgi:hypothetical protein
VPEILDRDLSRPDGVRWLLSFALRATMMLATSEKENSEEKRDAATHSLFCERISAETGTGGQRRQRWEGDPAQDWWDESFPCLASAYSGAHPYRLSFSSQAGKLGIGPETLRLLVRTQCKV